MWDGPDHDYEAVDPDPEVVLGAVRALDGRGRTSVSIFRGRGRLDVGGDADGVMVVAQADDRAHWHMVIDPAAAPDGRTDETVTVGFGRLPLEYPRGRTTRLPQAEAAVTSWLLHGTRDPGLAWWSDTLTDPAPRPATLKFYGG
jgi:hypothetical protein